jgi:hypothetical protein
VSDYGCSHLQVTPTKEEMYRYKGTVKHSALFKGYLQTQCKTCVAVPVGDEVTTHYTCGTQNVATRVKRCKCPPPPHTHTQVSPAVNIAAEDVSPAIDERTCWRQWTRTHTTLGVAVALLRIRGTSAALWTCSCKQEIQRHDGT